MRESGEILGVTQQLGEEPERKTAKHILSFIFEELVKFKSVNQEGGPADAPGFDAGGGGGGGGGNMMAMGNGEQMLMLDN